MKKLNHLQHLLPEGLVAPTSWLVRHGFSRALLSAYVRAGWLMSPARGVYSRPGAPLKWQNIVIALSKVCSLQVHVGGRTALLQHGSGHYLRYQDEQPIVVYCAGRHPSWVDQIITDSALRLLTPRLFGSLSMSSVQAQQVGAAKFYEDDFHRTEWGPWSWELRYASAERAMMEMLSEVSKVESIYEADAIMQSLVHLRPVVVSSLLARCTSIKVKRLFLALASRHDLPWLRHIEVDGVDLGSGKRVLVPGGRLHPKYQITLPSDLDEFLR